MKYSRLLKVTVPLALLYGVLGAVGLLALEVFWPLLSGEHAMMSVNWVSWAALLGWVTSINMAQSVIGSGFQTSVSRKTMFAVQWTLNGIIAVSFSLIALISQTVFVKLGLHWTAHTSSFPNFMATGHMFATFSYLGLLVLLTCAIGSLLGIVTIYLPRQVLLAAIFVGLIVVMPMFAVAIFLSIWGAQQLWPALMRQTWMWLVSIGGLTALLALAHYFIYQHLDAPEQIRRRS
jgi:hypothetical protein